MILQSHGVILDLVQEGRGLKKDDVILISYIDERLRTIKILVQFQDTFINLESIEYQNFKFIGAHPLLNRL